MVDPSATNQTVLYREQLPGVSWPVIVLLAVFVILPAGSIVLLPRLGYSPAAIAAVLLGAMVGFIATVEVAWFTGRLVSCVTMVTDDALTVVSAIGPWQHEAEYDLADVVETQHLTKYRQEFVRVRTAADRRLAGDWKGIETLVRTRQPQQLIAAIQQASATSPSTPSAPADTTPDVLYEEHIAVSHPHRGLVWSFMILLISLYNAIVLVEHRGVPQRSAYAFGDEPNVLDGFFQWFIYLLAIPLGVWGAWRLWNFTKSKTVCVLRDGVHYRYAGNRWRFYPIVRIQGAIPLTDQVVLIRRFHVPALISSTTPQAFVSEIQRAKLAAIQDDGPTASPGWDASPDR